MDLYEKVKKLEEKIIKIYVGIGGAVMAVMGILVVFTVVMRYIFALSWMELSEFNITLFAFTTFLGIGICILKEEHIMIDMLYVKLPPKFKKIITIINYFIVLAVLLVFTCFSIEYVAMSGKQISQGMNIPMIYMYGIMPVSGVIASICTLIKIVESIVTPIAKFETKEVCDEEDSAL